MNSFQINATPVLAVPEPLTILGAATAAGFGSFFKLKVSQKHKKKDEE